MLVPLEQIIPWARMPQQHVLYVSDFTLTLYSTSRTIFGWDVILISCIDN